MSCANDMDKSIWAWRASKSIDSSSPILLPSWCPASGSWSAGVGLWSASYLAPMDVVDDREVMGKQE